jgi:hypothetical protein
MMTDTIGSIKAYFLAECREDDCGLWFLVNLIKEQYPRTSRDQLKGKALDILHELLQSKKIKAIHIDYENESSEEWTLSVEDTIKKISEEWETKWKDMNGFDDIVWFVTP